MSSLPDRGTVGGPAGPIIVPSTTRDGTSSSSNGPWMTGCFLTKLLISEQAQRVLAPVLRKISLEANSKKCKHYTCSRACERPADRRRAASRGRLRRSPAGVPLPAVGSLSLPWSSAQDRDKSLACTSVQHPTTAPTTMLKMKRLKRACLPPKLWTRGPHGRWSSREA